MRLWLLQPISTEKYWKPWYDKAFGFVVCAESEEAARAFAAEEAGDEVKRTYTDPPIDDNPWLNPEHSSCEELTSYDSPGIVLRDFHSA